ncbi:HNH endonuclease signature motif containing protein [Candidatus Odyssella thessalonicensis]|uniref:HNH endonuclease signature motif containing protein n=1 Tax=Candidatus Odyssella thessalonicensis TaxID=84647 RepID=UPI00111226DE|nr:HNH endonuclease signature motif containing protein [Candidatus Odyssella thessalonicensis]
MYRCYMVLFLCSLIIKESAAAQRFIAGYRFSRLSKQEIVYLSDYLTQIESVSHKLLSEEQVKYLVREFDSGSLRPLDPHQTLTTRKRFQRQRLLVASDWSYYTQQRIPLALRETGEGGWDLHHIIFIRLNGQNEWWNIIPLLRGEHHKVIHGREQPGELLHRHLAARLPRCNNPELD